MLTNKQKAILKIIKEYIDKEMMPPTVREIGEIAGLSSTSTVQRYLDELERKGYIFKEKGCCRTIRVKEIS